MPRSSVICLEGEWIRPKGWVKLTCEKLPFLIISGPALMGKIELCKSRGPTPVLSTLMVGLVIGILPIGVGKYYYPSLYWRNTVFQFFRVLSTVHCLKSVCQVTISIRSTSSEQCNMCWNPWIPSSFALCHFLCCEIGLLDWGDTMWETISEIR